MTIDEEIEQTITDNPDLPKHFVKEVIEATHNFSSKEDLQAKLLHIFRKNFFLDNSVPIPKNFKHQENARNRLKPGDWIIDGVLQLDLREYFGSDAKMFEWLSTPHPDLGGERPGEYCTRHINGSLRVEAILNEMRLEASNNAPN